MTELKNCPFCGSTAFIEETDPELKYMFPYRIMCGNDNCAGRHSWAATEEAAIKAWNTRTDWWIRVTIDMPKNKEKVLVYNGKNQYVAHYDGWGWLLSGFGYINNVTHWMPRPNPPKEN